MKSLISKNTKLFNIEYFRQLGFKELIFKMVLAQVLFLSISQETKAQNEKSYNTSITSTYTSGHISQHSKDVSHTARGFTHGLDILSTNLLPLKTKMNDRQKLVYMDVGFHYLNYPMDFLGESFALTLGRSGTIFKLNKFHFYGQFLHGIGYCTNPFSHENNKNNAISTQLGFYIHGNITGTYPIYKNWNAHVSLSYSHLSNAAIMKPNLGYNVLSTNIGVTYQFKDKTINDSFEYYTDTRKYYYHIIGSFFHTSSRSYSGEKYPCYNANAQIERNLSLHHSVLLSIDYSNRQEVIYPKIKKPENVNDNEHNYLGVSIGGSWKYSIIDLNIFTGLYLIRPYTSSRINYNFIHFKIYALKNKYFVIGLKSHKFSAINFEAGFGVRL